MNLEQIMSFYNDKGKEKIYPVYQNFISIKKDISKFPNMSQMQKNFLISRIDHIKRRFEADFNYIDAQKWMQ